MSEYLIANYHAHTTRCKHARGTEREYIEAAIKAGIRVFGFSDHVPCPFKDGFVSGIRMDMEQAAEYVACIRALAKEYEGQIQILVGFETEYMPEFFEEQMAVFDAIGIDYMIMGQHFLNSEKEGPYTGSPTMDEAFIRAYVDRVIAGMKTGRFLYLAHPDLINYQGEDAIYEREMMRMCEALKEMGIPLEINLLGALENKHYPRERFWEIAGNVGNDVIFGLDVHWTEQIGEKSCYEKGLKIVEKYGLGLLHTFTK